MRARASLLALGLLSVVLLSGCVTSIFSQAKKNPQTERELKHMEQRMDAVEKKIQERKAAEAPQ